MSGLRDRIFPRSSDAPSEPREGDPATGETVALPVADRSGDWPSPDQTAGSEADESTAVGPAAVGPPEAEPSGGEGANGPGAVGAEPGADPQAAAEEGRPRRRGGLLGRRRKAAPGLGEGAGPPVPAGPAGLSPPAPAGAPATGAPPASSGDPAAGPGAGAGAVVQSPAAVAVPGSPGFAERSRLRRRLRYLRKLRELLLRDLGGFVFDARRFQRPRDDIVQAKLSRLAGVDTELRALEAALEDRRPLQELREPGIGGICDVCGSYFASTAKFCSECGSPATARREVATTAPAAAAPAEPAPAALPQPGTPPPPPAPAPDPAAPPPPTGTSLWSTGAPEHQATPPSGVEPVSADAAEAGAPAEAPAPPAGESPAPDAAPPPEGDPPPGGPPPPAAPPGGLARPDDESGAPPPMSSGDPLQHR